MDLRRWLALGRLEPEATFAKHIGKAERALPRPSEYQRDLAVIKKAFHAQKRRAGSPSQRIEPEAQGALECPLPTLD